MPGVRSFAAADAVKFTTANGSALRPTAWTRAIVEWNSRAVAERNVIHAAGCEVGYRVWPVSATVVNMVAACSTFAIGAGPVATLIVTLAAFANAMANVADAAADLRCFPMKAK
jgi:hypothetical protein